MKSHPHERRKHDRVKDQPRGPSQNSVRGARKLKIKDQRLRSREPGESPIDHYRPTVEIGDDGYVNAMRRRIEALEKENAEMRAKLSATDPISVLDAACRTSGIPLADDYEQRLAEWRAYVDAPVDPADLDSAIYRAMADDPKSYPPEKP